MSLRTDEVYVQLVQAPGSPEDGERSGDLFRVDLWRSAM
jgi:hypothetical protein